MFGFNKFFVKLRLSTHVLNFFLSIHCFSTCKREYLAQESMEKRKDSSGEWDRTVYLQLLLYEHLMNEIIDIIIILRNGECEWWRGVCNATECWRQATMPIQDENKTMLVWERGRCDECILNWNYCWTIIMTIRFTI